MGAFKDIGDKLADFVEWVKDQLEDEAIRRSIAEDLGLAPGESVPKADLPADKLDSINKYKSQANPDKEAFITLLNDLKGVYGAIRSMISAWGVNTPTGINELTYRTFDLLALNYVRLYVPELYFAMQAANALVDGSAELAEDDYELKRFGEAFVKLIRFAISPLYHLRYAIAAKDEAQAREVSARLFPQIAAILAIVGIKEILLGWDTPEDSTAVRLGYRDLPALARKLRAAADPVSVYLRQHTLATKVSLIDAYDVSGPPSATLRTALVDGLNEALNDESLFEADRFKHAFEQAILMLSPQFRAQALTRPKEDALRRFNKELLEAAYPGELSRSPKALADEISARMLTVAFPLSTAPTATSGLAGSLVFTSALIPATHVNPSGLLLSVGGEGSIGMDVGERWRFKAQASAQPAFSLQLKHIPPYIFTFGSATGPIAAPLNVALVSKPDSKDVSFAWPNADGTRLEIGELAFSFSFDGHTGGVKAEARRCAVVLQTKDQDGFLAKILPSDGLRVPFNLGVGYSTDKGFYKEGGVDWPTGHKGPSLPSGTPGAGTPSPANPTTLAREAPLASDPSAPPLPGLGQTSGPDLVLKHEIPIGKALIGVRLDQLVLGLAPSSEPANPKVEFEASISITAKLGPVAAKIERIGIETFVGFPAKGDGNAGPLDLSVGFKPPSGVGILIDSPFVSGGGFLAFDTKNGQYAGVVALSITKFGTISAIGLITTRLPSGAKGFSFVVLITVENFSPIQLGLGFSLTGIGGLLAINRTANEDYLREGIKSNTLSNILFPKNVIENAPAILGTLNNAFPVLEDSYVFGPMVQISWGSPPLLKLNLGIILELGNRNRLLILGVVSAIMPTEKNDLLRLQMNALGVIDFDQGSISLDAVLFDSRLVGKFPITGSMALRLNWGADPLFALSIGGFHPAFKPPPALPALERLAISLANSEDFRLRVEGYFAITSNTVQFGASLELYARVAGFGIEGQVGFDVLIQFDPFGFLADLHAGIQIKRGTRNLLKCDFEGHLSGPRPLHIRGRVCFEILWCEFSKSFDKTLISGEPPPKPLPVVVMSQLSSALADPRNWDGRLADRDQRTVSLREPKESAKVLLHPLGRLSVKQKVVPLNLKIARFGNTTPADARLFEVKKVTLNGKVTAFKPELDSFAPAQFLDFSDADKLAAPSFENMNAGLSFGPDSFLFSSNAALFVEDSIIEYETWIIDRSRPEPVKGPKTTISGDTLSQYLMIGAAGRSGPRASLATRYRPAPGAALKNAVLKTRWEVASIEAPAAGQPPAPALGKVASYAEAFRVLSDTRRQDPELAKSLVLRRKAVGRI